MSGINTMPDAGRYGHSAHAAREKQLIINQLIRIPGLHYQGNDHAVGDPFFLPHPISVLLAEIISYWSATGVFSFPLPSPEEA